MVDRVLADELEASVLVVLVYPDRAFRQRHAEIVVLFVPDFHEHADLLVLCYYAVPAVVIVRRAPVDKFFPDRDVPGLDELDLLGLVVPDRGLPLERVDMVLKEFLLLELRCRFLRQVGTGHESFAEFAFFLDPVHVAGHEFEPGVFVCCAALVFDGDPAREVGSVVLVIQGDDIIGLPGDAAREVRCLDLLVRREPVF